MISLDNDPAPLLGLTDVTCCPSHVCVLECDPHDIGIAVSYCFALHFSFFCTQWQICFFSIFIIECFLHPPAETQLGRLSATMFVTATWICPNLALQMANVEKRSSPSTLT